jgi:hypothetical protein
MAIIISGKVTASYVGAIQENDCQDEQSQTEQNSNTTAANICYSSSLIYINGQMNH